MRCFADLAVEGRRALLARDRGLLARLIDTNFETRRSIYCLPQWQVDMVDAARSAGASAKFAGSGGAIIGTCVDDAMFARVRTSLAALGCRTIKPQVTAQGLGLRAERLGLRALAFVLRALLFCVDRRYPAEA